MIRRLAVLGLLGVTACQFIEVEDDPPPTTPPATPTTGTVQGSLNPFRVQSAPGSTGPVLPSALDTRKLSQSIASALAAKQGVQGSGLTASQPVEDDAIPGDVIIRFEAANLTEKAALGRAHLPGYRAVHKGYLSEHLHVIGYEPLERRAMTREETHGLVGKVRKMAGVRYASKNLRVRSLAVPTDPLYSRQWHYPGMNLPAAWDVTTGSADIVTAVLDTGIVRHPDLDDRVIPGVDMISDVTSAGDGNGRDEDPTDMGKDEPNGGSSWHGSHVAGTIGAATNNGTGVAGVTWAGKLLPVRVLGRQGGTLADIIAAMNWASGGSVPGMRENTTPAKVINLSLGGESSANAAAQEVIDAAVARGSIFVIAAGNDNIQASRFFPCNQANVICVGATRFSGQRASYSNYGSAVDVMGTGGEMSEDLNGDKSPDGVLSTLLDDSNRAVYSFHNGTSMAAPHVAGIVALMASVNPNLTAAEAERILKETADTSSMCNEGCGAGLVNAHAAVLRAKGVAPDQNAPPKLAVGSTQLAFTADGTQQLLVRNQGGGTLQVTATAKGTQASALSFPSGATVSVPAYGSASLSVAVRSTGLASGDYSAQIGLSASNNESTDVLVRFRAGTVQDKDAIIAFVYQDATGEWQVDEEGVAVARSSGGYAYSVKLEPRTYYALATIDDDGDENLFEDGERVGFWRDPTNFEPISVVLGQTVSDIDFALIPMEAVDEQPTSSIGQPCESDTACGSGNVCAWGTYYPGGYCTQNCVDAACPTGSQCWPTDDGQAYCFVHCTGTGQGSCRAGYVCTEDASGVSSCIPQ